MKNRMKDVTRLSARQSHGEGYYSTYSRSSVGGGGGYRHWMGFRDVEKVIWSNPSPVSLSDELADL